jgi:hypothetical protein
MPTDSPWYPMALAHHCEALCLLSDCSFGLVLGEDGTGRAPHVPPRAEWRGRFRDNAGNGTGQILRVSIEPTEHCPADSSDRPWVSRRAVNDLAWAVGPLASLFEAWIFWPVEASWKGDPLESLTSSKQRSAIRE